MAQEINQYILETMANILATHVEPFFKPNTQLTLIARTPGNNEADVLVTSEQDLNEIVALVRRRQIAEQEIASNSDQLEPGHIADMYHEGTNAFYSVEVRKSLGNQYVNPPYDDITIPQMGGLPTFISHAEARELIEEAVRTDRAKLCK